MTDCYWHTIEVERKIAQIRANHLQLVDTRKYLCKICSPWTIYSSREKDSRVLGRKENDFVNLKFIHENDFPSIWTRVDVWWSSLATGLFFSIGPARELISIAMRNLIIFQLGRRKNSIKRWNWIKRMSRCSEKSLATTFFRRRKFRRFNWPVRWQSALIPIGCPRNELIAAVITIFIFSAFPTRFITVNFKWKRSAHYKIAKNTLCIK